MPSVLKILQAAEPWLTRTSRLQSNDTLWIKNPLSLGASTAVTLTSVSNLTPMRPGKCPRMHHKLSRLLALPPLKLRHLPTFCTCLQPPPHHHTPPLSPMSLVGNCSVFCPATMEVHMTCPTVGYAVRGHLFPGHGHSYLAQNKIILNFPLSPE